MNRFSGIAVAVSGVVVTALSSLKVVPLMGAGVSLIFLGLVLFGLSFIPQPAAGDTPRMPTAATLANIFFSPTEVFQNLRRHPQWLAALLISALAASVYLNAFYYRMTPERIVNQTFDKMREMPMMNNDARAGMELGRAQTIEANKHPAMFVGRTISGFTYIFFLTAFFSLLFWLMIMIFGGSINYWQAFSATAYAMLPYWTIKYLLSTIILFIKDTADIHPILGQNGLVQDNLGALFAPAENPALFSMLGVVGLLWFYWMWLNSIGLTNAGERVSSTAAWASTMSIWILALVLGAVSGLVFPGFLS